MLYLFLILRLFIPENVKLVIKGKIPAINIYEFSTHYIFHIISAIFAIIMQLFNEIFGITLHIATSVYKTNKDVHNNLGEFFCGIKSLKVEKFIMSFFLFKKGLYVALLIWLAHIFPKVVIYLRPFEEKKASLIKILFIYGCFHPTAWSYL